MTVKLIRIVVAALIATLAWFQCGPSIPIKFPQYPERTGRQLKSVLEGKRNIGIVAAKSQGPALPGEDWTETVEASVSAAIVERGYFNVVDVSSRKERLRELAYTQSGMTAESLEIGRELAINHLLVVKLPRQPRSECKVEQVTDYAATALALAKSAQGSSNGEGGVQKKPTGVLYLTVFVQGVLTNVETGRSVSFVNTEAHRQQADVGDAGCPSALAAFDPAVKYAAGQLARNLSPTVITMNVPLMEDAGGTGNPERVGEWLASGNQWAESRNFDQAAQDWRRALNESNGDNVSALWNLAVYSWYVGDYDAAERYFDRALDAGGPSWLDGAKRELISRFQEQKREEEGRGR